MIYKSIDVEKSAIMNVANLMIAAAKTAPKGCGRDNVDAIIVDGKDKDQLSKEMRKIAKETGAEFFNRDATNVDNSECVVIIGVKANPLGLANCKLCGFENCNLTIAAGANCAFNITDLGIAIGSAVSIAADHRIDNRVMFSAGKAALSLKLFTANIRVCYGIPLSTSAKSIFFDRDPGNVML